MSHPDPRPPAADGERALPEEIASAIEGLMHASFAAGSTNGAWAFRRREVARSALTTSILSRLTAAEAGREEALREHTDMMWQRRRAEERAEAALARVEKLEKALGVAQSALAMLTEPNEIRSTSVANAWAVAVDAELKCRQALTEAQPKGDQ